MVPDWTCWISPFDIDSFRISWVVQPLSLATMIVLPVSDVIWNVSSIPLPGEANVIFLLLYNCLAVRRTG